MADAVIANWSGHDFQARFFWIKASALMDPDKHYVIEVTYEADGPKSFDDVVVKYDPGRQSATGTPISVDYHQIKFHMDGAGRFGYEDLTKPEFLGAKAFSLLRRLQNAKKEAPRNSAFTLVTIDSIKDGDPLDEIVSAIDGSFRFDRLFDGTTDRSRMGKVRQCWRDHLNLTNDEELKTVLSGLRISAGFITLEKLRDEVNLHFRVVGLLPCHESAGFKYDAEARALKLQNRNRFDRASFEALCREQKWIDERLVKKYRSVSVRSFPVMPIHELEAAPEDTLSLLHLFDERHLQAGGDWQSGVQPAVEQFLAEVAKRYTAVRLHLDAHASIAFLAGSYLGLKSGIALELVQKGRSDHSIWIADDGKCGPDPKVETVIVGEGKDAALIVSLSRDAFEDVRDYVAKKLPGVGRLIHLTPKDGPGQRSIAGGEHAAMLADAAENAVRKARLPIDARTHIFVSGPNAFTFFLGQHRQAMGSCALYEFDFSRRVDGSYHPSFWME
ncbi:SAVED domain-containing protein [Mesorhizobium sp. ANAO-SY3R2]|uniref:SAVED domain-containing protein n=1 Tax=Mesorhizobium sp. ANAO-SY3R2 TaxID=3166644 RepID=UPI00366A7A5B